MLYPETFLTANLPIHPRGQSITRILSAAFQAVDPGQAVTRFVQREGQDLLINGQIYRLDHVKRILVIGVGKAVRAMSIPVAEMLADISPHGLLIPKQNFPPPWSGCEVKAGGHPIPNENSLQAGTKALELARGLGEDDLLICLISGGGSALMTAPHPGLKLNDLQSLTCSLLACGARIDEINTIRRHLDQVKGGGLGLAAYPAQVVSLILSDVIGNPLEAIASGPTAPDPTMRTDALDILRKYDLVRNIPDSILRNLETASETPNLGDRLFERVQNVLVGSNLLAAQAALEQARAQGFQVRFLGDAWQGESREVARSLCEILKAEPRRPICLIAGGETTVTLKGVGLGGRNQELALAAVEELAGLEHVMLISIATDGEDGPTPAAGAIVTGESKERAISFGLDSGAFLACNDSFHFFKALGDLLQPGFSGTNVNDLYFLFAF